MRIWAATAVSRTRASPTVISHPVVRKVGRFKVRPVVWVMGMNISLAAASRPRRKVYSSPDLDHNAKILARYR